jgi:hypothetical protein
MNIFATSSCPEQSAIVLPDLHINKMPVECCQMLAYIASPWFHNYGALPKKDGTSYSTKKNPHLKHPCTLWVSRSIHNAHWLIYHGFMLCEEFERRFNNIHACYDTLLRALEIFPDGDLDKFTPFERAMPDELKFDKTIDTFTAYKLYLATKPWIYDNYVKLPQRKPEWL